MESIDTNELKAQELEAQSADYKQSAPRFREEKRELWNKIILLSSAILGFSVTISSNGHLSTNISLLLRIGWGLFLVNILCGLFLLKMETEFQQAQGLANLARKWDEAELGLPLKTKGEKDKFVALMYLHDLRITPPKEIPFSQYAKNIYEANKKSLESWKMIKKPEKFYSYSPMSIIVKTTDCFYASFVLAMIFLIASVVL